MPKLMQDTDTVTIPGTSMQYSFVRPENLAETEYTLVTIVTDTTGSVYDFATELLECVKKIIGACRQHPKADNLLIRLITFQTKTAERHGFIPLSSIDEDNYEKLVCGGMTALYDATHECIAATLLYAKDLIDMDFDVNAINFIITDGYDNSSTQSNPGKIKDLIYSARTMEEIESLITVLIAINSSDADYYQKLVEFKDSSNLDQLVDAGEATTTKLAKLANFISQSISSQSKALGTGGPSVPLSF